MAKKKSRDIEKGYPRRQFVAKLHRLADAITTGKAFTIQTNHSITEQQIAWFKAGSALNALN